jgi:FdrA protein
MGTESNLDDLRGEGFDASQLSDVGPNDVILAVKADSESHAESALDAGQAVVAERGGASAAAGKERPIRSVMQAIREGADVNIALVSVPGEYAALEAHKALTTGLHVLLFSDNVSVEDEMTLKQRGEDVGLLVMGPGAGTARLGGIGLGFSNAVRPGKISIVAAAGTGAQECMTLLSRWGSGVRHVIGVGGRDLSTDVGGRMTRLSLQSVERDPETELLLVVSKPPSPEVATNVFGSLTAEKPVVAALVGLSERPALGEHVHLARTLEESVRRTLEILGLRVPDTSQGLAAVAKRAMDGLEQERRWIRGLFSGGTLCSESMVVMSERLGPIHSNVPLRGDWRLPVKDGHICLDLGEEEFTKGRPHPMIDPEPRAERIREEAQNPAVGVILLDVVLGYGAHADPASVLAPACEEAIDLGARVVAYVLGTDDDPQDYKQQRHRLEEAGCLLAPTGARTALLAAAIVARDPEIVEQEP